MKSAAFVVGLLAFSAAAAAGRAAMLTALVSFASGAAALDCSGGAAGSCVIDGLKPSINGEYFYRKKESGYLAFENDNGIKLYKDGGEYVRGVRRDYPYWHLRPSWGYSGWCNSSCVQTANTDTLLFGGVSSNRRLWSMSKDFNFTDFCMICKVGADCAAKDMKTEDSWDFMQASAPLCSEAQANMNRTTAPFIAALPLHVATEDCFETGTYSGEYVTGSQVKVASGAGTCQTDCDALSNPADASRHCSHFTYIAPATQGGVGTCHFYVDGATFNAAGDGTSGPPKCSVTETGNIHPDAGETEKKTTEKTSSSDSVGDSLDSTPIASSLTSSSLSSLPKWAVLLLFALLALALCGAVAMAMKKPKKKKSKRAKKESAPVAPIVETIVAPAVAAAPITTYPVPYAQPQVVEYVQPAQAQVIQTVAAQPQVVEYVQQPQVVEYVQQPMVSSVIQGGSVVQVAAPIVTYTR